MPRKAKLNVTDRDAFVRVLGDKPRVRFVRCSTTDEFAVFTETFGPPEAIKRNHEEILFWNFMRRDCTNGFALVSRGPKVRNASSPIKVGLVAKKAMQSFRIWTAVRLHGHNKCKERPLFVNGNERNFTIATYN